MECNCVNNLLWAFFLYFPIRWIIQLFYRTVYAFKIAQPVDLRRVAGAAEWAVITGATDGIGKCYATELAARGFKIVLIARNAERLEATAVEIREQFGVEVKWISFDFNDTSMEKYETLIQTLNSLQIGALVNNVGRSYDYPERIDRVGDARVRDVVVMNTLPTALLCSAVCRQMAARNAGLIINVGSAAGHGAILNLGVYAASKQFVTGLSATLRKEFASTRICIQTVMPMVVATKMSNRRPSAYIPSADAFVRSALRTVGHVNETAGMPWHEVQVAVLKALPESLFDRIARWESDGVRRKALRRIERLAADKQE